MTTRNGNKPSFINVYPGKKTKGYLGPGFPYYTTCDKNAANSLDITGARARGRTDKTQFF